MGAKGAKGTKHSQALYNTREPLGACPSGRLKGAKGAKIVAFLVPGSITGARKLC